MFRSFLIAMKELNKDSFYKSIRWQHKREAILRRDGYMCQYCKRYGRAVSATEVHHIKFLEDFPELALDNDNLVSLCSACHRKQHPEKGQKTRGRYSAVSNRGGGDRKRVRQTRP